MAKSHHEIKQGSVDQIDGRQGRTIGILAFLPCGRGLQP
jgi:hypothetical protein